MLTFLGFVLLCSIAVSYLGKKLPVQGTLGRIAHCLLGMVIGFTIPFFSFLILESAGVNVNGRAAVEQTLFMSILMGLVGAYVYESPSSSVKEPAIPNLPKETNAALSDLKKCPFCAESVRREAIKCKHCGSFIGAEQSPQ
jgi:hypothetical protein